LSSPPDTVFSVPGPDGSNLVVGLVLDVDDPDLTPVEKLLTTPMLDVLAQAVAAADQPYTWAAEHVVHAIDHLCAQEYVHAWPPLVTGIEGLFWAEAEQRGFIDTSGRFTASAGTTRDRPRSAIDVFAVLGMNERVQRFLTRFAFGGEANAFRHGRLDPIGPRINAWSGSLPWRRGLTAGDGRGWRERSAATVLSWCCRNGGSMRLGRGWSRLPT
jgi:hypothetical protein